MAAIKGEQRVATFTYRNSYGTSIPDKGHTSQELDVTGLSGGPTGYITDVSVNLFGLTHTYPDDLDMLLVSPGGGHNIEFWSDAGGGLDISNADFTISDAGQSTLPDSAALQPGSTYKPADYPAVETGTDFGIQTSNNINHASGTGSATFSSVFNGKYADQGEGTWFLYISDDSGHDTGALKGWGLTIKTDSASAVFKGTDDSDAISLTPTGSPLNGAGTLTLNDQVIGYSGVTGYLMIDARDGNDTITGSDAKEQINGGAGHDSIHAGGGDDCINFVLDGEVVAGETYDGGSGSDALQFGTVDLYSPEEDYAFDLRGVTVLSIEKLVFYEPSENGKAMVMIGASQIGSGGISATARIETAHYTAGTDVLAVTMGSATSVDLSGFTFAASSDPFDRVTITGGRVAETITGSSVRDTIDGGAGNDKLKGGGAADTFVFDTALNKDTNVDRIIDFAHGTDKIFLFNSIFVGLAAGHLSDSAFKDTSVKGAHEDGSDRILYNKDTGYLYFDRDGDHTTYGAVKFAHLDASAHLSGGVALTAADFIVV